MITLRASEKIDHLNLAKSQRDADARSFRDALSQEKEDMVVQLKRNISSICAHGSATLSIFSVLQLYHGLEGILEDEDLGEEYLPAQFFVHFFMWVYERGSEKDKQGMEKRLKGHLKSEQGLYPFFAELEAAFVYLNEGNDVILVDLINGGESVHDFTAVRDGLEVCVEVKSVRYDVGLPAPSGALYMALTALSDWSKNGFGGELFYEVKLVLKKLRRPTYELVKYEINEILRRAEKGVGNWESTIFRLEIKEIEEGQFYDAELKPLVEGLAKNTQTVPFHMTKPVERDKDRCLVGIFFEDESSLKSAIKKAVVRASRQLPKDKLGVVHVCIVESGFLTPDNLSDFTEKYMAIDVEVKRQLNKKGADNLAGIYIGCDALYAHKGDEFQTLSSFPFMQLIGNVRNPNLNIYRNNFVPSHVGVGVDRSIY